METLKRYGRRNSPTGWLGILPLAAASVCWSSQVIGQGIQPDEEVTRSETVSLLPAPKEGEYFFYFRDEEGYIVYLPPEIVGELFSTHVEKFLPLQRHVDIFQVFVNEPSLEQYKEPRGQWQIRYWVSMAIEAGDAAVWWYRDGFLGSIVVEHYTDHCCSAGRMFKTPGGRVLFRIRDLIID